MSCSQPLRTGTGGPGLRASIFVILILLKEKKKNGHTARNSHSEQVFSLISLSLNFLICKISTVAFVGQG